MRITNTFLTVLILSVLAIILSMNNAFGELQVPMDVDSEGNFYVNFDMLGHDLTNLMFPTEGHLEDMYSRVYGSVHDDPRKLYTHDRNIMVPGIIPGNPNIYGQVNTESWVLNDPLMMDPIIGTEMEFRFDVSEHIETRNTPYIGILDSKHDIVDIIRNPNYESQGTRSDGGSSYISNEYGSISVTNPDNYRPQEDGNGFNGGVVGDDGKIEFRAPDHFHPDTAGTDFDLMYDRDLHINPDSEDVNDPSGLGNDGSEDNFKVGSGAALQLNEQDSNSENQESSWNDVETFKNNVKKWIKKWITKFVGNTPIIFSLDGEPNMVSLYHDSHESSHWEFDLIGNGISGKTNAKMGYGTYSFIMDVDPPDGKLSNGLEWCLTMFGNAYECWKESADTDHNGILNKNDKLWEYIQVIDHTGNVRPELKPDHINLDGYSHVRGDDSPYRGQYSDCIYEGELNMDCSKVTTHGHFRVIAYHDFGISINGETLRTYDMLFGMLNDCTTDSYRYLTAENMIKHEEYLLAAEIYKDITEECPNASWGEAGLASIYHRQYELEPAKTYYEKAFDIDSCNVEDLATCHNHWYLADYAILQWQMDGNKRTVESCDYINRAVDIHQERYGYDWDYLLKWQYRLC